MVKIRQICELVITALADNGYGIAHIQRDIIYVRQALPDEKVDVRIMKRLKEGYVGEIVKWHRKDPGRITSPCALYQSCGSCHLMHCDYQRQLELKGAAVKKWVKDSPLRLQVHEVIGMNHPYAYRNKVIITFQKQHGRIQKGFYEEFSHRIIPYESCLLHDHGMDQIIHTIAVITEKQRIEPYDEKRRTGFLRHVLLRKGRISQEIMVVLVVTAAHFPGRKNFVSALLKAHPEITTIVQNINPRQTSVVLGNEERILYGKGKIIDTLLQNRYQISAKSFYQINHDQCEILYQKAISLLHFQGNETVIDAYCGIGTIALSMARYVKQVIGVENNRQAVTDAITNARENRIKNVCFICEDATHFMEQAALQHQHFDIILMDPPRSGSTEAFMRACAKVKAKQIVYISCDPRTQIRDLAFFKKMGYESRDLYLVDMFPHTNSIEGVCLLSKAHTGQQKKQER